MAHIGGVIAVGLIVIAGLVYRIFSLGSGAARLGFLPEKWQRWFVGGPSNPIQRR
jgi:hypothetical protein